MVVHCFVVSFLPRDVMNFRAAPLTKFQRWNDLMLEEDKRESDSQINLASQFNAIDV